MNAFLRITVFHLFLSEMETFRDFLPIIKYQIICANFFYISPELTDQPEEIKLLEKLISVAKGNGFETLKVCLENLTEHEMYICKRKGFREETSSDTRTVLCKHI